MLGRLFNFPPTLSPPLKSNFIYLLWDIGWWSLYMGATSTFLNIYAARCGATPQQIGLLTALPALVALLLSLPLGHWLKRFPAQPVTMWAAFASRIFYGAFPLLSFFLPTNRQFGAILALVTIISVPSTVINISFYQFFMDAVPADWRGTVVGARSALQSIGSLVVTLLCGQILARVAFPVGYQVVFAIGFAGAIMTVFQIARVHPIEAPRAPANFLSQPAPAAARLFPKIEGEGRGYLRVIGLLFCFSLLNNMAAPLIPNLLVHHLNLSDELISFGASTTTLVVLIVSLFMARLTRRSGANHLGTTIGFGLVSFQIIALALAQGAGVYLGSSVVGGIAGGVLGVAQYNYHLENVPHSDRSNWLSVNVLLGSIALLAGALGGPLVAGVLGTTAALILFGALELGVGTAILKWG